MPATLHLKWRQPAVPSNWTACWPYYSKRHLIVHPKSGWYVLPRKLPWACKLGSVPGMCPFSCHWPSCPDSLQSDYYITMNYTPWTVSSLWQSHDPVCACWLFWLLLSGQHFISRLLDIYLLIFLAYCSRQSVQFLLTPSCQLIPAGPS